MDHREARRAVLSAGATLPEPSPGAPAAADTGRLAERVATVGLVVAAGLAAAAILVPERLPFQDLPAHAALTQGVPGALAGTDPLLVATPWPVHGWLYELCAWVVSLMVGAEAATRLLLAASLVAVPAAVWHLLRTLGLPGVGAVFTAPLLFTIPVVVGYVPFLASIPLAIVTIAALLRLAAAPTRRRWLGVAALFLATYGAHAFGYVVAALGGAAAVLVAEGLHWRPLRRARSSHGLPGESGEAPANAGRAGVRRPEAWQRHVEDDGRPIGAQALADRRSEPGGRAKSGPLLPLLTAVPAGLLVVATTLGGRVKSAVAPGPGVLGRLATFVDRLSDVLISTVDRTVVTASLLVLLVAAVASRGGRPDRRWLGLTAAAAVSAALWLVLPEHVADPPIYQLADRFAVTLAPLLPAAAGLALRGPWRWLLVAPAGLAILLNGTVLMMTLDYGRGAGAVDRLLARVPDGHTLIGAVECSSDVRSGFNFVLVSHRPFQYELDGRGRVISAYGHERMPVHYRKDIEDTFIRAHPEILIAGNAHRADWVITDAVPQSLPDDFAGPGFRLVLVDREPGLRLFRIEHTP